MDDCFKGVDINTFYLPTFILLANLTYTVSYLSLTKTIRMNFIAFFDHLQQQPTLASLTVHDGNTKNSK